MIYATKSVPELQPLPAAVLARRLERHSLFKPVQKLGPKLDTAEHNRLGPGYIFDGIKYPYNPEVVARFQEAYSVAFDQCVAAWQAIIDYDKAHPWHRETESELWDAYTHCRDRRAPFALMRELGVGYSSREAIEAWADTVMAANAWRHVSNWRAFRWASAARAGAKITRTPVEHGDIKTGRTVKLPSGERVPIVRHPKRKGSPQWKM